MCEMNTDYGNADLSSDFDFLYAYSPLHNVPTKESLEKAKTPYPAFLATTADHDDRVVPLHSFKFMAQLQETLASNDNPLLIRIDVKAGHSGSSLIKAIELRRDVYAFLSKVLDIEWLD